MKTNEEKLIHRRGKDAGHETCTRVALRKNKNINQHIH